MRNFPVNSACCDLSIITTLAICADYKDILLQFSTLFCDKETGVM